MSSQAKRIGLLVVLLCVGFWLSARAGRLIAGSPNGQQPVSGPGPAALVAGPNFDSLDIAECCLGGGWTPPDPDMAAGLEHLVAVTNATFEVYNKGGVSLLGPTLLYDFFVSLGEVSCSSDTFNPNVLYDEQADRFIVGVDVSGVRYCVAVSQTGDPTGSWYVYVFDTYVDENYFDFPQAGIGLDAIYMGANMYTSSSGDTLVESRVWAFDKAAMYAGLPAASVSRSLGNDHTPQPVNLHGYYQGTWPTGGPHYILTSRDFNGETYALHSWDDPFGANTITELNIFDLPAVHGVAVGDPVDFPQSGGDMIQAGDFRPLDFEYRNGHGFTAMTVSCNSGVGTVDCVQWAEIDLAGASLVQTGVAASDGDYRTFPDVAANHCGDMAVGYTKSSAGMYPAVWATGRESGDAPGTLQAEVELKAGEVTYSAYDSPPRRWGEYTGMTIDPDGGTFWYIGEYSKSMSFTFGRWGTYISALSFPDCTVPVLTPHIEIDPLSLQSTQIADTVVTQTVTIGNMGVLDLNWAIEESPGFAPGAANPDEEIVFYTDRAAFEADNPGLPVEDFEEGNVPDGGIVACPSPLHENTNNACFSWGEILPGIVIQDNPDDDPGDELSMIGPGYNENPSISVFANIFTNTLDIYFPGPTVTAVGTDLQSQFFGSWLNITLYGVDGTTILSFMSVFATNGGVFWGVYSEKPIGRINLTSATTWAEGIDNIAFGYVPPAACREAADVPWATVSAAAGTTPGGGGELVDVTFDASGLAASVYTGTLCISSNDPLAPVLPVPLEMTVESASYGVALSGDQAQSGSVGSTVTYTLQVTNTGNVADTFDLTVGGNLWNTTLSDNSVTLAAGASATVIAGVEIPADAADGEIDVAQVIATSQTEHTESDSAQLTTTATVEVEVEQWYLYLPTIFSP